MDIESESTIAKTPWLALKEFHWVNHLGDKGAWSFVERCRDLGAVFVIAVDPKTDEIGLIRQFRPPARGYVWEFPAGLIDEGESPQEAGLRELKEEMGAEGEVLSVGPAIYSSPGLSNETVRMVQVKVTHRGSPDFQDSELIEPCWIPQTKLSNFLQTQSKEGHAIDAKLWVFGCGSLQGQEFCPQSV